MAISLKKIKSTTKQYKKSAKKKKKSKDVDVDRLIPSGITPFDLECSGTIHGAYYLGKLNNIIGDSHSGKTLLFLTIVAECCKLKKFKDYKFYLDDVEAALEFNIKKLFGKKVAKRLIVMDGIKIPNSETIEDFNDTIAEKLDNKEKFIYCLDSFDALDCEAARKKEKEDRKKRKAAKKKGQEVDLSGSYEVEKPKMFSKFCKSRLKDLNRCQSAIFVISQTRQKIGFGAQFNPRTRSGGDALRFYSSIEFWLATQKSEKDKKRTVLTNVRAKISKNKINGSKGEAYFPIRLHYGVDNILACINFLIQEGHWKKSDSKINTKGFVTVKYTSGKKKGKEKKLTVKELTVYIDQNNLEEELKQECQIAYNEVQEKLKPRGRKKKYE